MITFQRKNLHLLKVHFLWTHVYPLPILHKPQVSKGFQMTTAKDEFADVDHDWVIMAVIPGPEG